MVAEEALGKDHPELQDSGQSAFRWVVPAKDLYENEITAPIFHETLLRHDKEEDLLPEPRTIMRIAAGPDRRIIFYRCRG